MKLLLLRKTGLVDWDTYRSFVIRARTEEEARKIASSFCYGEGDWLDEGLVKCEEVGADGEPGVVLGNFKNG